MPRLRHGIAESPPLMNHPLRATLACNLDANLLRAALPLLEAGRVEAIEWSFDALFNQAERPAWFEDLLQAYSDENRLLGHGVYFSLFSGRWSADQQRWLDALRALTRRFRFDHVTEHFGYLTGADFHKGAPLSIPLTSTTLAIGQDRLKRLQAACGCPVGLENLAFAYSTEEVRRQGNFLHRLVEPVNGFLILDLHNLYCQLQNFNLTADELLALYPLDRVREIHLSGGSWAESRLDGNLKIRRDTHDEAVPDDVFALLERTMPRCPNLRYVVLEQLGNSLGTEEARLNFQSDFERMDALVETRNRTLPPVAVQSFLPASPLQLETEPVEDDQLDRQQRQLSDILETATDYEQARLKLANSELMNSTWEVEKWKPHMLETALAIAQKWKDGFVFNE